ncbi:MAG: histidine kinase, partial [Sphingobacteriaceae bacterium]
MRPAAIILLAWMVVCTLILKYFLNYTWDISITDSVVSLGLLGAGCVSISNLLGYYQPKNERILFMLIIAAMLTAVIVYTAYFGLQYLFKDNRQFQLFLEISIPIRLIICFLCLGWCAIANVLWYRLEEQTETQDRLLSAQNLAKEAELNKLRHQLQPHFLFNSLNSVYALTIVNPKEAGTMITKLAAFLRGTLK